MLEKINVTIVRRRNRHPQAKLVLRCSRVCNIASVIWNGSVSSQHFSGGAQGAGAENEGVGEG